MIIAFNGGMGSGKSTAIQFAEDFFAKHPVNIKFAQPLYDMQEMIYRRVSSVYTRPPSFVKDRKLLQWLGTEWGRETIGESIWIMLWQAAINKELSQFDHVTYSKPKGSLITCDDVRFDNEAEAVKAAGGYIIKIVREDNTKHAEGGTGIVAHKSEAGINTKFVDFTINNSDTLSKFQSDLFDVYKAVREFEKVRK